MIEAAYDVLKIVLGVLLGTLLGFWLARATEAERTKRDECRRLRDLAEELRQNTAAAAAAANFDFRQLPRQAWDDAPHDRLRREAADAYAKCVGAYLAIDELNSGSAEVRRRGQVRQSDEGIAKRDVRNDLAAKHVQFNGAHAALQALVQRRCI